jgi:predicted MarR family transcription regulator
MEWISAVNSTSKLEVLRVLFEARTPLRLRSLAELTSVSLRPVQLAIKSLEKDGLIKSQRANNIVTYKLNPLPYPLECFFEAIKKERLLKSAQKIAEHSRSLGPFQEDAFRMINKRK